MATLLLSRFQFVLLIGVLLLFVVSDDVKKKIKIPQKNWIPFVFLVALFLLGNLLYLLKPKIFYPARALTVLMTSFFFFYNWKILGFLLMGLGMVLNSVAILANGLKMPVVHEALNPENPVYVAISENTRLFWLGDIFKIQDWYGIYAFSIGDVLIYLGGLMAVLYLMYIAFKGTLVEKELGG